METNFVNNVIRENATTQDWRFRELQSVCHAVAVAANLRFFDSLLTTPVLVFDLLNSKTGGRSIPGHSPIGTQGGIVLNSKHFTDTIGAVLAKLLHELVYHWVQAWKAKQQESASQSSSQRQHPQKLQQQKTELKPYRTPYHNKLYVAKSEEIGIVVLPGRKCEVVAVTEAFLAFLHELGIDPDAPAMPDSLPPTVRTPLAFKTWRCGCIGEAGIAKACEEYKATCGHCGQEFVRSSHRKSA